MNDNYGIEITDTNKGKKGKYDLNEDGTIDMKDRNILMKNYVKTAKTEKWEKTNPEITLMNLDIVEDINPDVVGAHSVRPRNRRKYRYYRKQ